MENVFKKQRYFLKDSIRKDVDFSQTDQGSGVPAPPLEKPFNKDSVRVDLVPKEKWKDIKGIDLVDAIERRRSHRKYTAQPLTLSELSFLLWATQGVQKLLDKTTALRTVPSAGCRHALETYLCVLNVEGLTSGFYRYLPLENQLLFEFRAERAAEKISRSTFMQSFIGDAPVTFIWTVIPHRMEWRYGLVSHRLIALDAGHICQNLYLACEAIGAGTCGIAAYDQEEMDALLRVDGEEEFTIYMAPVGKIPKKE